MLTHKQEKLIKSLYTRHGRKKHKMCICEGVRACGEYLMSERGGLYLALKEEGVQLPSEFNCIDFTELSAGKIKELSHTVNSQGIIFIIEIPESPSVSVIDDPYILLLEGVADPGNLGTIIRSCKAVGLKNLCLISGSADPFGDKVIRSAMGAQFYLNIFSFSSVENAVCELRKLGYGQIWRTDCRQGVSIFDAEKLFDKSVIIFGGEANGAGEFQEAQTVTIPMPGNSESINLAQAVTVCLFESVRRKII